MQQGRPMPFPKYNLSDFDLYKSVFFHTTHLAYILDKKGNVLDGNQNFLDFLGLKSIQNKSIDIYSFFRTPPQLSEAQEKQNMKTSDLKMLSSNAAKVQHSELALMAENGAISRYQVSRIPIQDENKNSTALLVLLKDHTLEKHLQKQVDNIEQELLKFKASNQPPPLPTTRFNNPQKVIRILVIEDNKTAQFAAQRILMQIDCQVDVIDSETQLLAAYEHGKYDLVLMDIGLEKTNGLFLSKIIRKQEKNTEYQVPIILLTSYETEKLADECQFYQLNGALAKPLTLENARQLIKHFVLHSDTPVKGLKHSYQKSSGG